MTKCFAGISFPKLLNTGINLARCNDKHWMKPFFCCGDAPWKIVKSVQVADNVVIVVLHLLCNLWEELCPKASLGFFIYLFFFLLTVRGIKWYSRNLD